eukprot:22267-Chlamydomonas_euryale.AAC.2
MRGPRAKQAGPKIKDVIVHLAMKDLALTPSHTRTRMPQSAGACRAFRSWTSARTTPPPSAAQTRSSAVGCSCTGGTASPQTRAQVSTGTPVRTAWASGEPPRGVRTAWASGEPPRGVGREGNMGGSARPGQGRTTGGNSVSRRGV